MNLSDILEHLAIEPNGSVVYFHISANNLAPLFRLKDVLDGLDRYFGASSTLCMPSYPFSLSSYAHYLATRPEFDVRTTPSRVSLACEVFRRKAGIVRSVHPLSVACRGPLAQDIVSEHHAGKEMFGKESPFRKIMELGGQVVGLGVDCNTNSFAHIPDDRMRDYYTFSVYDTTRTSFPCRDYSGNEVTVSCYMIDTRVPKIIRPRKMKPYLREQAFYREMTVRGVEFYSMRLTEFVESTVNYNYDTVREKGIPVYYEMMSG